MVSTRRTAESIEAMLSRLRAARQHQIEIVEALGEQLVETRSLQVAYQAEVQTFCAALERGCRDLNAGYSRVLTNEPVDLALRRCLLERARTR